MDTNAMLQAMTESLKAQAVDLHKLISSVPPAHGHSIGAAAIVLDGLAKAIEAAHAHAGRE